MTLCIRDALASDVDACIDIRGKTRDNPVPVEVLREFGVTAQTWRSLVNSQTLVGSIVENENQPIGFCFGDTSSGEIVVLALLPEYENLGLGKNVLLDTMDKLRKCGHRTLFLAASPDPTVRAHGFYRHLGWRYTHKNDEHGDEILEYRL